jgi:hypothetical protein
MPPEAGLFDAFGGSPVEAFFLLREDDGNILPAWIDRATDSRKSREERLAELLGENSLDAIQALRDWELSYRNECFYYGLRVLLKLARNGKSKL